MARFRDNGAPDEPTDLGARGWWAALKRTVREFKEDNLTDWAAALTYYGVLVDLPGAARARLDPRAGRRVGDAAADRQPRDGRAGSGEGDLHERDREPAGRPGRGRRAVRRRPARRALVGVRLRRRVHARVERDLRRARRAGRSGRRCRCASALTLVLLVLLAVSDARGRAHRRRSPRRWATSSASATPP